MFKLEALNIFRDVSNLSVSPELWQDIVKALDQSEFFVLLASPEAAKSKWVNKEIEYWITHKPKGTLLIALVNGQITWDENKADFDWNTTDALPQILSGLYLNEPNYANFKTFKTEKETTLNNIEFQEEIAKLAAPLHKKTVGQLIGIQEKQFRKKIFLRNLIAVSLTGLLIIVTYLALKFKQELTKAEIQLQASRLGVEALESERIDPTLSIEKLIDAFNLSGDSSLYSSAVTIYNRNYIYDRKISKPLKE